MSEPRRLAGVAPGWRERGAEAASTSVPGGDQLERRRSDLGRRSFNGCGEDR